MSNKISCFELRAFFPYFSPDFNESSARPPDQGKTELKR